MIPLILLLMAVASVDAEPVRVGSKSFTESVILGEIVARLAQDAGPNFGPGLLAALGEMHRRRKSPIVARGRLTVIGGEFAKAGPILSQSLGPLLSDT